MATCTESKGLGTPPTKLMAVSEHKTSTSTTTLASGPSEVYIIHVDVFSNVV